MFLTNTLDFTNNPEDYAVGDTITINLQDGTKALYELTSIE